MDFFKESDLQLIGNYAGLDTDPNKHEELKKIYEKLGYLCSSLEGHGFITEIRKDPRKQAGTGRFVFQEYQWAKIFPKEFVDDCKDKYAYIIGLDKDSLHFHLMGIKDYHHSPHTEKANTQSWTDIDFKYLDYPELVKKFIEFDKLHRKLFIETGASLGIPKFTTILQNMNLENISELLSYKKQIILQGPPGTGKTFTAKNIAKKLTEKTGITKEDVKHYISVGQSIKSCTDYTTYIIQSFTDTGIKIKTTKETVYEPKFNEVIESFSKKTWQNGKITQGNDSYSAAIAKHIYENFDSEDVKLVQFHPAYSYEDFVRGITIKPNDQTVTYEAENKTLIKLAQKAIQNFENSKKPSDLLSKESWLDSEFEAFLDEVELEITTEGKYKLNEKVSIFSIEEDAFRYSGDTWVYNKQRMKFSDIKTGFLANIQSRNELSKLTTISSRARNHASYDFIVLEKFRSFLKERTPFNPQSSFKEDLRNYVLIIDEINRANLPAVLGELIYALEYRGEAVDTIYEKDGDNKITLPPNLYLIGTMNTADRSVGHIDYAIRRRFAFVDILPSEDILNTIKNDEVKTMAKNLFKKVAVLFSDNNISPDFKIKDVQLGHSYFLADTESTLELKLIYEIIPLLTEYFKDGIFRTTVEINGISYSHEDYLVKLKSEKWN
jgi:hypothetical protein